MPCTRQTTAKYTKRPGPPYPAQQCRGQWREGNDGFLYHSKRASNGVYRWVSADDRISRRRSNKAKRTRSRSGSRRGRSKSKRTRRSRSPKKITRRSKSSRRRSSRSGSKFEGKKKSQIETMVRKKCGSSAVYKRGTRTKKTVAGLKATYTRA